MVLAQAVKPLDGLIQIAHKVGCHALLLSSRYFLGGRQGAGSDGVVKGDEILAVRRKALKDVAQASIAHRARVLGKAAHKAHTAGRGQVQVSALDRQVVDPIYLLKGQYRQAKGRDGRWLLGQDGLQVFEGQADGWIARGLPLLQGFLNGDDIDHGIAGLPVLGVSAKVELDVLRQASRAGWLGLVVGAGRHEVRLPGMGQAHGVQRDGWCVRSSAAGRGGPRFGCSGRTAIVKGHAASVFLQGEDEAALVHRGRVDAAEELQELVRQGLGLAGGAGDCLELQRELVALQPVAAGGRVAVGLDIERSAGLEQKGIVLWLRHSRLSGRFRFDELGPAPRYLENIRDGDSPRDGCGYGLLSTGGHHQNQHTEKHRLAQLAHVVHPLGRQWISVGTIGSPQIAEPCGDPGSTHVLPARLDFPGLWPGCDVL